MKRRVLLIMVLLLALTCVKGAYFTNLPYKITQPDGKTIDCFVTGDEYFNWIHDANGYTIIQAPDGYYYYGEQNGDIVQPSRYLVNSVDPASVGLSKWIRISKTEYERRRSTMLSYQTSTSGPGYAPSTGSLNNLVVYIRFSDETEFTTTRQVYDDKFNPATGVALKSYFREVSYNNLTISSTHYPACALTTNLSYQDSHARGYFQPYNATTNPIGYTGGSNGTDRTTREHQLLVDAVNWINVNSPVSPSLNIDGDGDGNVDNVCFIVKGSSGGWAELLWAHRWVLYSQTVNINGKRVYDYTFQPENQVSVTTLCHEMFHALGSPDLYHYYTNTDIAPVWTWDLMEAGSGHMLTYMKWKYSNNTWINTIPEITSTGTYTLNPVTSPTNNCYKIASPYSTDEYFVVEYRNKSGTFETNVAGSGLIVYRIDTRNSGNAEGPPDEVYVYRPNGTTSTNGTPNNAFFSSTVSRTAINDATNPNSFLQNGSIGGLDISNVSAAGTTISFKVTFPAPCTQPTNQATAFTSSAITNSSITAGWTRGNGNAVLVVATKGGTVSAGPVNGTAYTANAAFGSGTQIGSGNYVIYNGTGSSVNLTGLSEGSGYSFAIYEYSNTYCYKSPSLTGSATTTGYCTAGALDILYEYISNVAIGSISNSSGRGVGGYQDVTSLSTTMQIGVNATATISVTNPYSGDQVIIWVDWNQDGDFTDPGENVYSSSGSFTTPHTTSDFAPPIGAAIGTTRMRIRLHDASYQGNATPCGDSFYGEVEDYSINVIPGSVVVPVLTTNAVFSITQTASVSGGNITSNGGGSVTSRGVCWSTITNPTITNSKTIDGTDIGIFVSNLTGLLPGTLYYVRAYATNTAGTAYGNEIAFKTYNSDAIQDIDGNYYNIVTIGSQIWMAENLKTTQYYDMTDITLVTDNTTWSTVTTPAYCWFENNATSYKDQYGGLYNWYAVNTGKLCPAGWHVPIDEEWTTLFSNLGGETVAGGKLKSTGTLEDGDGLWYSPNTGATNVSGFTALPAGGRVADEGYQGVFLTLGFSSYFWSNSESSPNSPIYSYLWNQSESAHKATFLRQTGFSVRCLKDNASSGTHFVPVWSGSGMDHMNFYAFTAKLDNVDLQPGDEIGIFDGSACVGMGTITQVLTGSVYLSMVASKDDPDTPSKDGFTQDNAVTYRVWDKSAAREVPNALADYISGVGIFSPGSTSTFNLNANTYSQDIVLTTGWNIMSFAGEPDNMLLMSIVTPLKNAGTLVKIQDEKGNAIEQLPAPIGWVDNIGLMKVSEGYKIKVSANTTLSGVTGNPVILPYTITLETGWNIMGYPSMNSQAALAAFQSLIDAGTLLKVQDEKGNAIEKLPAPIGWVDNIHTLVPGEGYKIKVSGATSITINNSGKGEYQNTEFAMIKPSHFKPAYTGNGLDHMNIYLKDVTTGGSGIKPGDEIGVFDGGLCVGAVVVQDPNSECIMLTASLDDPTTQESDGYIAGHNIKLKLWDSQSGIERNTRNVELEKGSGNIFERLGTSMMAVDFETRAKISLGDAYPNPSKDKTTFTFQLPVESKVRLEIYNIKGELVKVLVDRQMTGGLHQVEWDNRSANGPSVSSGIYFYKLITNTFTQTKQLVVY